jgi:hypothetical protein
MAARGVADAKGVKRVRIRHDAGSRSVDRIVSRCLLSVGFRQTPWYCLRCWNE